MRIKNIIDWKKIENLFIFTRQTWSKWKKENRPIINLIEKYFTDKDIEEFLNTGKISRFEKLTYLHQNIIFRNENKYLKSFKIDLYFKSLQTSHSIFIDFYFSFLVNLKELSLKENIYDFEINHILFSSINTFLLNKYNNQLLKINNLKKETIKSLKIENETNLINIQKHISCFNNWDKDMLFYLDYVLNDNLQSFLDSNNEELIYHAICFNIFYYLKDKSLENLNKEEIIHNAITHFIINMKNIPVSTNEIYLHIEKILKT